MARMSLPPGFRFHPTDVELVMYYLKRKSLGKRLRFEAIAEVNFYKYSPWDLPDKSCLKNKDLEWFFFCPISRKYASGSRSGRATETGYWKATGKDRAIMHNEQSVGMIKTLVFHLGHAPKGERTDWVMHEYRILEKGLADTGVEQSAYVLVKLFKKSGLGPKNGAQYGAPFNEEEWAADDDDEIENYAATFQPSATFPSSAIANNNSHSVVTSTYTHGSTSSASLQPLSVIAYNSSYSVDTAPKSASLPLTAVTTSHCNSIGSSSFVPPSDPLLALAHNSNSVTTDTFFHGGTSTGSLPVLGPPTVGSLANEPAGDKDVESLLAMFTEDDFLNMPSELNEIQVNGEEFLELDDIFADLGDLTDWEKLRKRLP